MEANEHNVVCLRIFPAASPTPEPPTLSLHDALPILRDVEAVRRPEPRDSGRAAPPRVEQHLDRKSTRLNSSHVAISYAVFCLKKKKTWDTLILIMGPTEFLVRFPARM